MKIKIIKNRSDIGAGTRGSDMGIDAIEIAAINANNNYFTQFDFEDIETENESVYNKVKNSFGKRIEHVFQQCTRVSDTIQRNLKDGNFPLIISGDHSSALGTISGIKVANPNKTLGVVWIDAHADIHSPYTSPSGNVHGMPLAAAMAEDNKDCMKNTVTDETKEFWNKLKNIGTSEIKVKPENIVYFGVRDTEEAEAKQMEKLNIRNYKVEEIRYRGLNNCVNEAINKLANCDIIYVSFDVDSMDCDLISYGTGTPVPKGFDQFECTKIINGFLNTNKVVCLEFVEVNPLLDFKGNKMAETAFCILDEVTNVLKENL